MNLALSRSIAMVSVEGAKLLGRSPASALVGDGQLVFSWLSVSGRDGGLELAHRAREIVLGERPLKIFRVGGRQRRAGNRLEHAVRGVSNTEFGKRDRQADLTVKTLDIRHERVGTLFKDELHQQTIGHLMTIAWPWRLRAL